MNSAFRQKTAFSGFTVECNDPPGKTNMTKVTMGMSIFSKIGTKYAEWIPEVDNKPAFSVFAVKLLDPPLMTKITAITMAMIENFKEIYTK